MLSIIHFEILLLHDFLDGIGYPGGDLLGLIILGLGGFGETGDIDLFLL